MIINKYVVRMYEFAIHCVRTIFLLKPLFNMIIVNPERTKVTSTGEAKKNELVIPKM